MKNFVVCAIGSAALLLLAAPAHAAGGYYGGSPEQNWAGAYAGLSFGGVIGEFTNAPNSVGPNDVGGDIAPGAQLGFNWQFGQFVYGGEADLSWIPFSASSAAVGSYNENWMASMRVRGGFAVNQFLPYLTAGLALTDTQSNLAAGGSDSEVHAGLVVGGGVEFACHENWSVRGEYLHADVPNQTSIIRGTTFTGGSGNHLFRAGINYHF